MFHPGTQDLPQQGMPGEPRIPPSPPRREVVLETIGLTKAYGKRLAVNGLNLEIVGLRERGKDRYSAYSLGMRQRLAVGAALLTDPELIILDEPGNGLDPAGIVEIRELIRKLSQQGKTIFVSSHILAEVRQVCTRIGIIRGGQLIGVSAVDDLLRSTSRWEVQVDNPEQVCRLLSNVPIIRSLAIESGITGQSPLSLLGYNKMV